MDTTKEDLELQIKKCDKDIELRDALNRLSQNKDFIEIIDKGFFETKAVESVMLKADIAMQSEENQKDLDNWITAIGYLRLHFRNITRTADVAERTKAEALEMINDFDNEEWEE